MPLIPARKEPRETSRLGVAPFAIVRMRYETWWDSPPYPVPLEN